VPVLSAHRQPKHSPFGALAAIALANFGPEAAAFLLSPLWGRSLPGHEPFFDRAAKLVLRGATKANLVWQAANHEEFI
jgi:hypothetical protein